jgi:hypothetical protein
MRLEDFIIDFDRVNELSSTKDDNPNEGYVGTYHFAISRKIVRQYLDILIGEIGDGQMYKSKHEEILPHVINTLVYNRILIHKATLRDNKIDKILEDE